LVHGGELLVTISFDGIDIGHIVYVLESVVWLFCAENRA
jgi:hypothetical protein